MPRRPAVSMRRMSLPKLRASRRASLARRRTSACSVGAVCGVEFALVDLGLDGVGDDFELLAGGGTVDVHGHQHRPVAALFEPLRELAGGGGFAGALEAGHEDDGGGLGGELEARGVAAEDVLELVGDDLDELLGGGQGRW